MLCLVEQHGFHTEEREQIRNNIMITGMSEGGREGGRVLSFVELGDDAK